MIQKLDTEITRGDRIRIKDNLREVLLSQGFEEHTVSKMEALVGSEQNAYAIWCDHATGDTYVTIDICCEIPLQCCERV